jgi:cell wall assembly regulator SMI1
VLTVHRCQPLLSWVWRSLTESPHALRSAGLPPTPEVLEWLTWHEREPQLPSSITSEPSGFEPLTVEQALEERLSRLQGAEGLALDAAQDLGYSADFYWGPRWLPIGDNGVGGSLAVVLDPDAETARVLNVDWTDHESLRTVRAPSIADAVRLWIQALETDLWTWSATRGAWENQFSDVPLGLRQSGLIGG